MRHPVVLHRVHPARNMARCYVLVVHPNLFGGCETRNGTTVQVRFPAEA
jgi:hypothetical protein